jgi:hypothetical protein
MGLGGHILIIALNLVVKPIKCNNQDMTPITHCLNSDASDEDDGL